MENSNGTASRVKAILDSKLGRAASGAILVIIGGGIVAFASTFLFAPGSDDGSPAAAQIGHESGGTPAPDLSLSAGLGELDSERVFNGLIWLNALQHPAPTPTSTPAPTPTAAPAVVAQDPSAPSQGGGSSPPPPPPPQPPAPPPASCPSASMSGQAAELFNAINNERTSRGMAALGANGCVTYVAQLRSQDMAANNYFAHESPSGQTAFSLMDANGVGYGWAGENLARNNYPDGETVGVAIRDLMNSPGHRDNILSPNYTQIGVAAVNDGTGMWYYTMIFIGPP